MTAKKNLLFILMICCAPLLLPAQHTLKDFYLFEDSSRNLNSTEVLKKFEEGAFYPAKSFNNIGFTPSIFWLAYHQKTSPPPDWYLQIGDHHINFINSYFVINRSPIEQFSTGDHLPFKQRPLIATGFHFPIKENGIYLFMIDKSHESLQITLDAGSEKDILQSETRRSIVLSILTGMMLLMIMFGIFLFAINRQKVYAYYVIYLLIGWLWVLAHSGFGFQYLWPESNWFASRSRPIFALSLGIFLLLFMMEYVNAPKNKITNRIVTTIIVLYSIFLITSIVAGEPTSHKVWMYLLYIIPLLSFFYAGFTLIFLFKQIRRENRMAEFYLAGASILIITSILQSFLQLGQMTDAAGFFIHIGMGIGFVIESIVITAGLVYSFNKAQKEKATLLQQINIQQEENTKALMDVQQKERSQIADQLHDVAGSLLSAARLNLSQLRATDKITDAEAAESLLRSEEAISQVSDTVRNLSHALSPVMLKNVGLKTAIDKLAYLVSSDKGIQIETAITGFDEYEPQLQQHYVAVHSIVYELLNNIIKHSNAKNALVQVTKLPSEINIIVEDNGTGHVQHLVSKKNHQGIEGIKLKVAYLKGEMSMDNNQPSGIITTIVLPI
jgi:signal transduction histidine kinase